MTQTIVTAQEKPLRDSPTNNNDENEEYVEITKIKWLRDNLDLMAANLLAAVPNDLAGCEAEVDDSRSFTTLSPVVFFPNPLCAFCNSSSHSTAEAEGICRAFTEQPILHLPMQEISSTFPNTSNFSDFVSRSYCSPLIQHSQPSACVVSSSSSTMHFGNHSFHYVQSYHSPPLFVSNMPELKEKSSSHTQTFDESLSSKDETDLCPSDTDRSESGSDIHIVESDSLVIAVPVDFPTIRARTHKLVFFSEK
uniref:CHHC U11-48K-type domain-containing protein n=1 Tax=Heterorhabditis bacteriophora TaxID=37862 RepID=A0A1I7WNK4_HETBA